MKPLAALVAMGIATLAACGRDVGAGQPVRDEPPALMLWAWERNEDFGFLRTGDVGVAFLASTVTLEGDAVGIAPRRQPLRLPDTVWRTAVVRIESVAREPGTLSPQQRDKVVDEVRRVAGLRLVRGVQIDFDAARSQRAGYRVLLEALREALPDRVPLSMTALASWCVFDTWMDGGPLAVDEVVPMLFMMGQGGSEVWSQLGERGDFRSPSCRSAIGVLAGEPNPAFASGRRTYVFSRKAWTRDDVPGWACAGAAADGGER